MFRHVGGSSPERADVAHFLQLLLSETKDNNKNSMSEILATAVTLEEQYIYMDSSTTIVTDSFVEQPSRHP